LKKRWSWFGFFIFKMTGTNTENGRTKIKPVFFMCDPDMLDWECNAVLDGILAAVNEAGASGIAVNYLGSGWDFPHVAEHAESLRDEAESELAPGKFNAKALVAYLTLLDMDHIDDQYSAFATCAPLWDGRDPMTSVEGDARRSLGMVVSTAPFRTMEFSKAMEHIGSITMHLMGHTFGAVPDSREYNVAGTGRYRHCADKCVMAPIEAVLTDAVKLTNYRKRKGRAFCQPCVDDMRKYLGVTK
jgi:hypothetical protein